MVCVRVALFSCFVFGVNIPRVIAQFCADTCPPLVNGVPIPSLCESDTPPSSITSKSYRSCSSSGVSSIPSTFSINDFAGEGRVIVIANYYIGCNAGRRESGVFAHVGQRYFDLYGDKVIFINSLKGGASCEQWASLYQTDALQLYPNSGVTPKEMPITVNDVNFELRDDFFTTPFGHPSYVIMDGNLEIRKKFIGPCCGYESYFDCTADIAKALDGELSSVIDTILGEEEIISPTISPNTMAPSFVPSISSAPTFTATLSISSSPTTKGICTVSNWSKWSPCSKSCGSEKGIQFRYREILERQSNANCPDPVETRECSPECKVCKDQDCILPLLVVNSIASFLRLPFSTSPCIPEFGNDPRIRKISTGFDNPRDVAFHPTPGLHLGDRSEGRTFDPDEGDEAWVLNAGNHSVSIVASLGSRKQTTISRRDRGYYHYMIEATALSFNKISNSGRDVDKDSFNYWAVCNDNPNDYLGSKEPNFFMGPTLYNSFPESRNTVNRLGEQCDETEPCFFLHADMLHEAPACVGITHDPETVTAFGNVYWAFDSTGNNENGQLVRFDFQQPHGPGSMDHSVASVRRYPGVKLTRGPAGVHAGMIVHEQRRELFISNPGDGTVIMVKPDSGTFARTAREEYPIFSNRLPSFEYSIWECVDQQVFASNIVMPSGLALSPDGERLFVAEHFSGKIHVYEVSSAALLTTIETGLKSIGGMDFSPTTNRLHFVDSQTNALYSVVPGSFCSSTYESRTSADFVTAMETAAAVMDSSSGPDSFSLIRDYQCVVDPIIPDASFFEQVHSDSGYASNDTNVQNEAGMDDSAALLANRTDCGYDSELNFDALLLGGYFCHVCLPDDLVGECDMGGKCTNVQWEGYTCDNEYIVEVDEVSNVLRFSLPNGDEIDPIDITLSYGITYRFTVKSEKNLSVHSQSAFGSPSISLPGNDCGCASMGPLLVTPTDELQNSIFLHSSTGAVAELQLETTETSLSIRNGRFEMRTAFVSLFSMIFLILNTV